MSFDDLLRLARSKGKATAPAKTIEAARHDAVAMPLARAVGSDLPAVRDVTPATSGGLVLHHRDARDEVQLPAVPNERRLSKAPSAWLAPTAPVDEILPVIQESDELTALIEELVPRDMFAPSAAPTWSNAPAEARATAAEQKRFIETVNRLWVGTVTLEEACLVVEREPKEAWPILCCSGKHKGEGRTPTTYINLRKKTGKRGKYARLDSWQVTLLPQYRSGRQPLTGEPDWWRVAAGTLITHPGLAWTSIHKYTCIRCRRLFPQMDPKAMPTYEQLRYWLNSEETQQLLKARSLGAPAYEKLFGAKVTRAQERVLPMQEWILDHRILDLYGRRPADNEIGWEPCRFWISGVLDWGSRRMIGWVLIDEDSPNCETIILAFMHGLARAGGRVPQAVYIDNGQDYLSRGLGKMFRAAKSARDTEFWEHSVFKNLGIRVNRAKPHTPQSKLIERFFRDMSSGMDPVFPSYVGRCIAERPESADYYHAHVDKLLTIREVATFITWWLEDKDRTPSKARGLDGLTPLQRWESGYMASEPWDGLALTEACLRYVRVATVGVGGTIMFDGRRYTCPRLHLRVGDRVMVRIDVRSDAVLYCSELDGSGLWPAPLDKVHDPFHGGESAGKEQAIRGRMAEKAVTGLVDSMGKIFVGHAVVGIAEDLTGVSLVPEDAERVGIAQAEFDAKTSREKRKALETAKAKDGRHAPALQARADEKAAEERTATNEAIASFTDDSATTPDDDDFTEQEALAQFLR